MTNVTLKELVRLLTEGPSPHLALIAAKQDGSLARLIPELDVLAGVPQRAEFHPEVDTFKHMVLVMEEAAKISDSPRARFAALVHDLGKGVTPADMLPRHHEHEINGVPLVQALCARLEAPDDWTLAGTLASKWHLQVHKTFENRPGTVVKMFIEAGFMQDQGIFEDVLLACEADKRGRLGFADSPYPQRPFLLAAMAAVKAVEAPEASLSSSRVSAVKEVRKQFP